MINSLRYRLDKTKENIHRLLIQESGRIKCFRTAKIISDSIYENSENQPLILLTTLAHPENISNHKQISTHLNHSIKDLCHIPNIVWIIVKDEKLDIELKSNTLDTRIINVSFPSQLKDVENKQFIYYDRGCKHYVGLQYIKQNNLSAHVFFYDYDDHLTANLQTAINSRQAGYYLQKSYVKDSRNSKTYTLNNFYAFCGSSHIIHTNVIFASFKYKNDCFVYLDSGLLTEKSASISTNINWDIQHEHKMENILKNIDTNYLIYILGDHGRKTLDYYRQLGFKFQPINKCVTWQINHGENHGGKKTPISDPHLFSRLKCEGI